jgi:hypothetical protein
MSDEVNVNIDENGSISSMKTFSSLWGDLILPWFMSAAVLFYGLPQAGVCCCGDQCNCDKSAMVSGTVTDATSCCCFTGQIGTHQTVDRSASPQGAISCCSGGVGLSTEAVDISTQDRQTSCGCSCVRSLKNIAPMIRSIVYPSGELKMQLFATVDITPETLTLFHLPVYRSFNGWTSVLGMRLHLFLQVLLI